MNTTNHNIIIIVCVIFWLIILYLIIAIQATCNVTAVPSYVTKKLIKKLYWLNDILDNKQKITTGCEVKNHQLKHIYYTIMYVKWSAMKM